MANEPLQEINQNKAAVTDNAQTDKAQESAANNMELINGFNEILGNHIERLLDTRMGIEELDLNIFSVSCIVLLATRETEIETFPAQPPPRYTISSLIKELAEMSIEPDSEVEKVINDMIYKGYIKITDDRIFSNKPMSSMAQLFDRIFPRMPGLNLVAYLGQMIDEVTAGRKSQTEASKQFNQMLEIQGVSINESMTARQAKRKFSHLRVGNDTSSEKSVRKPVVMAGKPVNIFSQLKTGTVIKTPVTVKEKTLLPVDAEIKDNTEESISGDTLTSNRSASESDIQQPGTVSETRVTEEVFDTEDISKTNDMHERVTDSFEPVDDKEIEDRILEFEEQLGLKCPLCRTGGIKTSETAKGKPYYHCSNAECNFISWGKPYYFECPKCDSDFLIEITDSSGRNFLKCPKATCSHWQKFPWDESDQSPGYSDSVDSDSVIKKPVRKVRRRRVVRRKKPA